MKTRFEEKKDLKRIMFESKWGMTDSNLYDWADPGHKISYELCLSSIVPCNYQSWAKKGAWRLHEAATVLIGLEPEPLHGKFELLYILRQTQGLDAGKSAGLSVIRSIIHKVDKIFNLAKDEHEAGQFQIVGKWVDDRVLVNPQCFLTWAESKGYHVSKELMEAVKTNQEQEKPKVNTPSPITSPDAYAYRMKLEGLTWFEIGSKMFPEEAQAISNNENGAIKRDSFISRIKRIAEKYAEKINEPLPK